MINFKNIKYKNFLSVGNKWIELDFLVDTKKVLIGTNGTGKSSMQDALCFALYNKAFRKTKKDQLINSINGKDLQVVLDFSIGNKSYRIERGVKPTYCKLFINGVYKEMTGSSRDYQAFIENTILRMSEKTFRQIVVLGSTEFVPFMKLAAASKRSVVEDLLDVSIFSSMSDAIKIKANISLKEVININEKIKVIETSIKTNEKSLKFIDDNSEDNSSVIDLQIQQAKILHDALENKYNSTNINVPDLKHAIIENNTNITEKNKHSNKVKDLKSKIENNLLRAQKESKFFDDNNNCHVCLQDIDNTFKNTIIDKNSESIIKYSAGIAELNTLICVDHDSVGKYTKIINDINEQLQDIRDLKYELDTAKSKIDNLIESKNSKSIDNSKIINNIKLDIDNSNKLLTVLTADRKKIVDVGAMLSYLQNMLKDDGIKSKIIKTYLPVINKLMQKYLNLLGMNIDFEFDEYFEETIRAKHQENFSYGNFSTGQQLRIDLAILFLWRDLAKLKNSTSTNLLILDEITSSSMDDAGIEAFNIIIDLQIDKKDTVVIITHSPDSVSGKEFIIHKHKLVNNYTEIEIIKT